MKKETSKNSQPPAMVLLDLLKRVLPVATSDAALAGKIYSAVENDLKKSSRKAAFEKFCQSVELPDLEPETIKSIEIQFKVAFGPYVATDTNAEEKTLTVSVLLSDGSEFSSTIAVHPLPEDSGEQEIALKFIPFPVCLPGDKELVWLLAKRENMRAEDSAIALTQLENEFWASKTGQKLLRDRVERSFLEFISRVPAGALNEVGLKRLFKLPEVVKELRTK